MTYPEPTVEAAIGDFVAVQLNVTEEGSKSAIERVRQVWTPDLHVLGPDGFEYDHWNGFLPPFEFLPRLLVGRAQAELRQHHFPRAAELYESVLARFPTSFAAPEALYFLGVARYEDSHSASELTGPWHRLQSRYPASRERVNQSFVEK